MKKCTYRIVLIITSQSLYTYMFIMMHIQKHHTSENIGDSQVKKKKFVRILSLTFQTSLQFYKNKMR